MDIYLEIFGYIGSALVIVSMMMTSVLKLRIINMCGGVISLIYAACIPEPAWPVIVLNACLISINFVQTVRQLLGKEDVTILSARANDPTVQHLMHLWQKDVKKNHPNYNLEATNEETIHILYVGEAAVGFFTSAGEEANKTELLYLTPSRRTAAMKKRTLELLAKQS